MTDGENKFEPDPGILNIWNSSLLFVTILGDVNGLLDDQAHLHPQGR